MVGALDRRPAFAVPQPARGAPRLSHGRAGDPLAEACRPPALLPRRDDRALRRASARPPGRPRGGGCVTLCELLEGAGNGLPGVDRSTGSDGATIWLRGERAFATLSTD